MTLAAQQLAAEGLAVQVARGRAVAPKRLHDLVALAGASQFLDGDVAVREAELATWQGDLDRARSAIQRALAAVDAVEHLDKAMDVAWIGMKGLMVEAEGAERARTAGDAVALTDAIAVGGALLERAHSAVEQAHRAGINHDVHVRGWLAKAEAEGPGSRVTPTRRAGRRQSRPSRLAMSMRWLAASGAWRRRCLARATGNKRPLPPRRPTRTARS